MAQRSNGRSAKPEESQPRSEYWRGQSEAWLTSGLTQADFCEEHELSLSAFRWWRWKLKQKDTGNKAPAAPLESTIQGMRLVPVRVVDADAPSPTPLSRPASIGPPSAFELVLQSGTWIRVPRDFDTEALSRLLRTLEAVEC